MIQGQLNNGRITKWMLPVVLVLSLFTFSGISTSSSAKLHKTTIEQIDLVRVSDKKCASFKIIGRKSASTADYLAVCFTQITICHTRNVETQVKQCTRDCLDFIVFSPSSLPQYSLRNSVEEFSIFQIG